MQRLPLRLLLLGAFMAALGATLALMLGRAIVTPLPPMPGDGDFALLHQVGLGIAGSLVIQLLLLGRGTPPAAIYGALWGLAGFWVLVLAPWLALPDSVPGQISAENGDRLLLWGFSLGTAAAGLWALLRPGTRPLTGRFGGLVLLALPLLVGSLGWAGTADRLGTPGFGLLVDAGPDFGVWRRLGLNLLFWLLLGVFSALSARRAMPMRGEKSGPVEAPPEG